MKPMKKSELNQNIYISKGNTKLARNEHEYFLIWNLPSVITCPFRTRTCEVACYARKAEVLYPSVLPCRERNLQESIKSTFIRDMVKWIEYLTNLPKNRGKKCYFRIHESGDFYSKHYLDKWVVIASMCPDIQFMAYTKSVQFINGIKDIIPYNLTFRYSVWEDTNHEDIGLAHTLELPIYTAFPKHILEHKVQQNSYIKCNCDCSTCKDCYNSYNSKIAVAIH